MFIRVKIKRKKSRNFTFIDIKFTRKPNSYFNYDLIIATNGSSKL